MKLRKLKIIDAPYMLEWMKDEDINFWFRFDSKSMTIQDAEKFIASSADKKNQLNYAIVDENDIYQGTVSLKEIDKSSENAEYAICLRKNAIGKGFSKFATNEILRIAFEDLKLEKVYLNVLSDNIRAWKFYEKFGFVLEGEFRKHLFHKGELKNIKWYSVLKGEFYGKNK